MKKIYILSIIGLVLLACASLVTCNNPIMAKWWPGPGSTEAKNSGSDSGGRGVNFGVIHFNLDFVPNVLLEEGPQPKDLNIAWDGVIGRLRPVTRTGYGFTGWYDENGLIWDVETRPVLETDDVDGDGFITLTARWDPITISHTVRFVTDPSTNTIPPQLVGNGHKAIQPVNPPKLEFAAGAEGGFAGWYTDGKLYDYKNPPADLELFFNDFTTQWNFNDPVTGNITLYAKWELDTGTVIFRPNGGTRPDGSAMTRDTFLIPISDGKVQDPGALVKEGCSFGGWFTDDTTFNNLWNFTTNKITVKDSTTELFAKWVVNIYYVNFVITPSTAVPPGRQEVTHNGLVTRPDNPPQLGDGRGFSGWYTVDGNTHPDGWHAKYLWDFTNGKVTKNMTFYARWTPQTRTVHFNVNGGLDMSRIAFTIPLVSGVIMYPGAPQRAGHTFDGWYTDPACTTREWNFQTDRITAPDEIIGMDPFYLYAKWIPNKYTVTFVENGGFPEPADQIIVYGERAERPPVMKQPDKAFEGWFTKNGDGGDWGEEWDFDTGVTSNITLNAKWDAAKYTVIFHLGHPGGGLHSVYLDLYDWPAEQQVIAAGTVTEIFMLPLPKIPLTSNETNWSFYSWDYQQNPANDDPARVNDEPYRATLEPWDFTAEINDGNTVAGVTSSDNRILNLYARWVPPIPDMVWVPRGTFTMGDSGVSSTVAAAFHAYPTRQVTLDGFYINRYQVTQSQYDNLMSGKIPNSSPSNASRDNNRPVERVSWYDAVFYCNELNSNSIGVDQVYDINGISRAGAGGTPVPTTTISGSISSATVSIVPTGHQLNGFPNGYRLPTEAEWEYAARGGNGSPGNFMYAGSNNADDVAWYNVTVQLQPVKATQPYGTKAPNALGIYDMSGNVSEWCWDWFYPYKELIPLPESYVNPKGPDSPHPPPISGVSNPAQRIRRGGAWNNAVGNVRSAMRNSELPENANWVVGFRVVRGPSEIW